MVLLALDFLYYSAMNYEVCRVYLEKWGLGGRWLKRARSQWNSQPPEEGDPHNYDEAVREMTHESAMMRVSSQEQELWTPCYWTTETAGSGHCLDNRNSRMWPLPGLQKQQEVVIAWIQKQQEVATAWMASTMGSERTTGTAESGHVLD
ncbi:hypothetical protein JZ751_011520 [Albula glossodonta]|uniref:Uncharacterized protein n=1 Tax=Albula glossodonta TaxID=121402 RepID=A0A8T2MTF1_9TELE|nr:hypothetical protein JZ751_011520 [Albula glossodonta]